MEQQTSDIVYLAIAVISAVLSIFSLVFQRVKDNNSAKNEKTSTIVLGAEKVTGTALELLDKVGQMLNETTEELDEVKEELIEVKIINQHYAEGIKILTGALVEAELPVPWKPSLVYGGVREDKANYE
jgi:hypothetical protein